MKGPVILRMSDLFFLASPHCPKHPDLRRALVPFPRMPWDFCSALLSVPSSAVRFQCDDQLTHESGPLMTAQGRAAEGRERFMFLKKEHISLGRLVNPQQLCFIDQIINRDSKRGGDLLKLPRSKVAELGFKPGSLPKATLCLLSHSASCWHPAHQQPVASCFPP